jgi:predicted small secreted protein
MRKIIHYAVTLAVLVIGAASQTTTPAALPTVSVAGQDIKVAPQGVVRAAVADLSVDVPVWQ